MKEIGIGIVGFGFMGKTHTYGYKTIPLYYEHLPFKIKLVGVCDTMEENAVYAKEMLGFEFATNNPDDLFERKDIDVVNICTPNIYHKEGVLKALAAKKNVYCDKPLAASFKETQEITRISSQNDMITQMALQYRFYTISMRAKEIIEEGKLGNPLSFRVTYLHSGSVHPDKPIGWKQDKRFGGGGVLFDLGSHALDFIYYLLGEYAEVFAKTKIQYDFRPDKAGNKVKIDAEDQAIIIARTKSGAMGTIEASKIATGTNDEMRVEIHGDKGALRLNFMEPNYLEFYDDTLAEAALGGYKGFTRIECVQRFKQPGGSFPASKFSVGWIRSHVHSLYNFLECVDQHKKASPSFEEGAYIQLVMEKAYESDEKSAWVTL